MDQHLGYGKSLFVCHEGLALKRRPPAAPIGKEAGGDRCHTGPAQVPKRTVIELALESAVPRPETPVLMHHQTDAAVDAPGKRFSLGQRWRQGLLAEHIDG